ncbi:MAG: hypothetical protein E7A62_02460 [Actinomycetaceae bacterium]|nr:hypothetical protein [Actinomycetaceae bacterium]MDU0969843.1 hypothetical protein [Actinomycetaceae bacterium]
MRVGVNYVPRSQWFYQWGHLDPQAVRDDLAQIADLGLDHVRIFPLWALLQPNRALVSPDAVRDVLTVVETARDQGLRVSVDVLQGHLSSFDFLPSWVLSWHARNVFTDPEVVAAQRDLIRTLAGELRGIEGVDGLSLGNEFIQFAAERHPHPAALDEAGAAAWVDALLGEAKAAWPAGTHTLSYDDDLLFDPTHPFTPRVGLTRGDVITVHSWIFGRLGPALGADHPRLPLFARYLLELVRAWAAALGTPRPLWLQEVGAPLNYLSPDAAPDFLLATLDHAASVPELEAVTWWCSHDVSRELADFPAVEYDLGLIDSAGRVKPTGRALAQWAADMRAGARALPAAGREPLTIPAPDAEGAREAVRADGALFARWAQAIADGAPLTLSVQEDRA